MEKKLAPQWPAPGDRALVTKLQACKRGNISPSTWDRQPGTPEPVLVGARSVRFWSDEVDAFYAAMPRRPRTGTPEHEALQS